MDTLSLSQDNLKSIGLWSLLCLVITLLVISLFTGFNPLTFFNDLPEVMTANYNLHEPYTVLEFIKAVIHSTLILVVFGLLSLVLVLRIVGMDKIKTTINIETVFENGPLPIYLTVFGEELIFRQVILGWLRDFMGNGATITVILFIVSTAIFAILHIFNHQKEHRSLTRILPQLILGTVLAYVFLRFGFWVAFLSHIAYDLVMFSSAKAQPSVIKNLLSAIYWLVVGAVSFLILTSMGLGFSSLLPWIGQADLSSLSLTTSQMAVVSIFITAIMGLLSNLFLMDEPAIDISIIREHGPIASMLLAPLTAIILVCVILGLSWLLGLLGLNLLTRAIIIIAISLLLSSGKSGSAAANQFLFGSLLSILLAFTVLTFGFWPAFLIIFSNQAANYIPLLIYAYSDDPILE